MVVYVCVVEKFGIKGTTGKTAIVLNVIVFAMNTINGKGVFV
jgi:hypothetical protein